MKSGMTMAGKRNLSQHELNVLSVEKGLDEKSPSSHKSASVANGRWNQREHYLFIEGKKIQISIG